MTFMEPFLLHSSATVWMICNKFRDIATWWWVSFRSAMQQTRNRTEQQWWFIKVIYALSSASTQRSISVSYTDSQVKTLTIITFNCIWVNLGGKLECLGEKSPPSSKLNPWHKKLLLPVTGTVSSIQMVVRIDESQQTDEIPFKPRAFPFFIWEIEVLISSVMGLHSSSLSMGLIC